MPYSDVDLKPRLIILLKILRGFDIFSQHNNVNATEEVFSFSARKSNLQHFKLIKIFFHSLSDCNIHRL